MLCNSCLYPFLLVAQQLYTQCCPLSIPCSLSVTLFLKFELRNDLPVTGLVYTTSLCLQYKTVERGKKFSPRAESQYRVYFQQRDGVVVSPWHDIPLHADTENQVRTQAKVYI